MVKAKDLGTNKALSVSCIILNSVSSFIVNLWPSGRYIIYRELYMRLLYASCFCRVLTSCVSVSF